MHSMQCEHIQETKGVMKLKISLEKPSLDELTHFGILGMHWGVRKKEETTNKTPKLTYYDRSKADYLKRGFTKADAENLAKRKSTIRTASLIAGGVTLAVGAALVARYLYVENVDTTLKTGEKAFHIARGELKDLEAGRNLFVTIDQADRMAYQWRLNNPLKIERIERTLEFTKDIKIPNPKKSVELYNEFMKDPNNSKMALDAFEKAGNSFGFGEPITKITHDLFVTVGPYFSKGESMHGPASNNEVGENLWKTYKDFLVNKGYQGILDTNDRAKGHGFNVERPAIIFDAANALKDISRKVLKDNTGSFARTIPTIREIGSSASAAWVAALAGTSALTISSNSKAIESYRRVYPNSKKSNKEIIKSMSDDYEMAYKVYDKVEKLK